MTAFRRLVDGDLPAGATGLDVGAVRAASRELYRLDGQISFDRAVVYARIFRTLTAEQKRTLGALPSVPTPRLTYIGKPSSVRYRPRSYCLPYFERVKSAP